MRGKVSTGLTEDPNSDPPPSRPSRAAPARYRDSAEASLTTAIAAVKKNGGCPPKGSTKSLKAVTQQLWGIGGSFDDDKRRAAEESLQAKDSRRKFAVQDNEDYICTVWSWVEQNKRFPNKDFEKRDIFEQLRLDFPNLAASVVGTTSKASHMQAFKLFENALAGYSKREQNRRNGSVDSNIRSYSRIDQLLGCILPYKHSKAVASGGESAVSAGKEAAGLKRQQQQQRQRPHPFTIASEQYKHKSLMLKIRFGFE